MSGKPSPEGAEAVRFMLRELREQQAMDVHTAGNYGWEARTVWFLLELTKPGAL